MRLNPFNRPAKKTAKMPAIKMPTMSPENRFQKYLKLLAGGEFESARQLTTSQQNFYLHPEPKFRAIHEASRILSDRLIFEILVNLTAGYQAEMLALRHPEAKDEVQGLKNIALPGLVDPAQQGGEGQPAASGGGGGGPQIIQLVVDGQVLAQVVNTHLGGQAAAGV